MVFLNIALALLIVTALWLLSAKLSNSSENDAPASVANALSAVDASTLDSLTEQKLNEQKKLYQKMLAEQTKESGAQIQSVLAERDDDIILLKQQNENLNVRLTTLEQQFENSLAPTGVTAAPKSTINTLASNKGTASQAAASKTSKTKQVDNSSANTAINTTKVVNSTAQVSKTGESQTRLSNANAKPLETEDAKGFRWLAVKAGDTLSIIAARVYQDKEAYGKILKANPEIQANPDLIVPGLRLKIPD